VTPPPPPMPPPDIDRRRPTTRTFPPGAILHRFFLKGYDAVYFDRSPGGRFNSPDNTYGVMYAAEAREGAFAETFLREPGRTYIPLDLLNAKGYVRFRLTQPLTLIQFAGPGLAKLGATAEVCHRSQPYACPQAWSRALHGHPSRADGILYTARHDDQAMCIALFERARDSLAEAERLLDLDQDWFWQVAGPYGVGIPPT
jgi:hypothetical protein